MPRLPQPGGDNGNWGVILNDFLAQALKPDGAIKDNAVTSSAIAPNAVNDVTIADGSITEVLLATAVQTKLNAVAGTPDWNTITNKPAVIAAGVDATAAKAALALVKSDVGLGNVDNTSDAAKNSATATLTNKTISGASNTLSNIGIASLSASGTANASTYLRGDNSWAAVSSGSDWVYLVDDYGADPTGAAASDVAIASAISALGSNPGVIEFGVGTYRLNSSAVLAYPGQYFRGQGMGSTMIDSRVNGITLKVWDSTVPTNGISAPGRGGGLLGGMTISGLNNTNNNAIGLQIGDLIGARVENTRITAFTTTGAIGFLGQNRYSWTEYGHFEVNADYNTNCIVLESHGSHPLYYGGKSSWSYNEFIFGFSAEANQDGFVVRNKVSAVGLFMKMMFNCNPGATNTGVAVTVGTSGTDDCHIEGAIFWQGESTNAGVVGHTDMNIGADSSLNGTGELVFNDYSAAFVAGTAVPYRIVFSGRVNSPSLGHYTDDNISFATIGSQAARIGALGDDANYLNLEEGDAGTWPMIRAAGPSTDIGMILRPKGAGQVEIDGSPSIGGDITQSGNRPFLLSNHTGGAGYAGGMKWQQSGTTRFEVFYDTTSDQLNWWNTNGTDTGTHMAYNREGYMYLGSGSGVDTATRLKIYDNYSTSTTADVRGLLSEVYVNPSGTASSRAWGVQFVGGTKSGNAQDLTGGDALMGFEGKAQHNGTGTVTGANGGLLYVENASSGTITNARTLNLFPMANGGGGTITNAYHIVTNGLPSYTANGQKRIGIEINGLPDPGIYTGTTTAAISLTGLGGSRDGMLLGGDTNLYRSAADTLKTDDNLIIGTPGTAAGSVATIDGTQTLTNKSLTDPKINSIKDANGFGVIDIGTTAGGVNGLRVNSSSTGTSPFIEAVGSDTNVGFAFRAKGTGSATFYDPSWSPQFAIGPGTPGSNVNYAAVGPAVSGTGPYISATGSDTNVDLNLYTKGTGAVKLNGNPAITTTTGIPAVTGTPSSSNFLRGDGTWATPAGGGGMLAPVQGMTLGDETFTISAGSVTQISGTTINAYTPAIGDRILVAGAPATSGVGTGYSMTSQPANGIYVVTGNTTNLTVTRATDMSGSVHPASLAVYVQSATWPGDKTLFFVDTPNNSLSFTWGTTSLKWTWAGGPGGQLQQLWISQNGNPFNIWNGTGWTTLFASTDAGNQNLTLPATSNDTIVARTSTDTLTNKRITKRVSTVNAPGATPTISSDSYDGYVFTGINADVTSMSSGLTGTPTQQQPLVIRMKDDGTARTITWGASWRAIGVVLPTTTVVSKTLYIGALYNATDSLWDVTAVAQET